MASRTPWAVNTAKARKMAGKAAVESANINAIDHGYMRLNWVGIYQGSNKPYERSEFDKWLKAIFDEKWEKCEK